MKISVEATALTRDKRTGVDYYSQQLLKAMAKARPDYQYVLGYFRFFTKCSPRIGIDAPNVFQRRISWLPTKAYNLLYRIGIAPPIDQITGTGSDFYIFPNFVRWPLSRSKYSAVIVYDLSFVHSPRTMTKRLRCFLLKNVPTSIAQSDLVITISETIRNEIILQYNLDPKKVVVALPAADPAVFYPRSEASSDAILSKYELYWRRFILFVGTIEPRKNIERLLDAFSNTDPNIHKTYPLVLVGGKGWEDEGIYRKVEQLRQTGFDIRMLGYVPYEQLPLLYSACAVFVFPSLYEGFGMPVLEAMACGAAVITSACSSLPEVVGDVGAQVDPENAADITAIIEALIYDEDRINKMREAGILRADCFSWDRSAMIVLNAIESIVHCAKE